jgi:hypothetical protein
MQAQLSTGSETFGLASVLERHLLDAAGLVGGEGGGGAVTLIQRFGSAANLNIHLHCLVLDGVYRSHADGVPEFIEGAAPTEEALHALLQTVIAQLMQRLTHRGVLVEDDASRTSPSRPQRVRRRARCARCGRGW